MQGMTGVYKVQMLSTAKMEMEEYDNKCGGMMRLG